jgi:diketogulonate reductase-like aldo/keto reductase
MVGHAAELANGVRMPVLGLGTWMLREGEEVERVVGEAIGMGYRHVDTAAYYGNEAGVGRAVRASGMRREEVFVTSKVTNDDQRKGYDGVLRAFDASLDRLGLGVVDLYLIHWPVKGMYKEAWRALERIYKEGRARAIGVSNFLVHHLEDLLTGAEVKPMVNQVEMHPWLVQPDLRAFCRANGIVQEAWSPLMQGRVGEVPELGEIARRHGKSPAQVVLRWDVQHGVVTIPKTAHRRRLEENAAIFDFELSPDEMATIDSLDRGQRLGADPDHVTW